jgi:hypothetical protein
MKQFGYFCVDTMSCLSDVYCASIASVYYLLHLYTSVELLTMLS